MIVENSTSIGGIMDERFERFTVLIAKISRNIRKIKNKEMADCDLRSPHVSCLYYLYTSDSLTATDLCERCEEDKATISRSIDYLEKNGYIACQSRKAKRYKAPLVLTEKGEIAGKRIADRVKGVLDEIDDEMTAGERENFYKCLSKISDSLDALAT